MRIAATAFALLLGTGCLAPVRASVYATAPALAPSTAPVAISATADPAGARALGVVEASGQLPWTTLDTLVSEFRTRVASMGGDFGRIDSFATRRELVTETYDYDCGTDEVVYETRTVVGTAADGSTTWTTETVPVTRHVPRTCTGERTVEVATLALVGRALLTSGRTP